VTSKEMKLEDLLGSEKPETLLTDLSFENGLKLLEELVGRVESGALPLEKAISSYEKGVALIEHLRKQLSGAEEKLKMLQKGS